MISSDAIGLLFAAKFEGDSAKKDSAQLKDAINKDVADIEKTGTGATGKVSGGFDAVSDKAKVAGAAIASVAATAVGVGAAFLVWRKMRQTRERKSAAFQL